jgi:uncharacterized protein
VTGTVYHEGELAVQARAGVAEQAQHIGATMRSYIPSIASEFLRIQRMVVLATLDPENRVWASVLTGPAGFVQAVDSKTVEIKAIPSLEDPLESNLNYRHEIGMVVVEFSTRHRMKVKGLSERTCDGSLLIHAERVYSQCAKYIQARELLADSTQPVNGAEPTHLQSLTPNQQKWISSANTFFIASFHPETGADASHRGGNAGFVRVVDKETLLFPNYPGNMMFNTLGNISLDPHAGLVFLEFATGSTLQITGKARIIWDKDRTAEFPGANQAVEYRIKEVIETPAAVPLRWRLREYSSANPG